MLNNNSSIDDLIALYKKDVDFSLIRENLKLTVEERIEKLTAHVNFVLELRRGKRQQDLELPE